MNTNSDKANDRMGCIIMWVIGIIIAASVVALALFAIGQITAPWAR